MSLDPSIIIALIALAGTVLTAIWGRRSARDSTAVEERRVGLEVLKTSLSELRTTVDDERARSRELEEKVSSLSRRISEARSEAQLDAEHIDVLERWIWDRKAPPPPPRPTR